MTVYFHFSGVKMHAAGRMHKAVDHQHRGKHLAGHGCVRNARHAHIKAYYRNKVQRNVQRAGYYKIIKRALSVPHRAQYARAVVIYHQRGKSGEVYP